MGDREDRQHNLERRFAAGAIPVVAKALRRPQHSPIPATTTTTTTAATTTAATATSDAPVLSLEQLQRRCGLGRIELLLLELEHRVPLPRAALHGTRTIIIVYGFDDESSSGLCTVTSTDWY